MKARVVKTFTMGDRKYFADQEVDLEDWRVTRLVGEGLVTQMGENPKPLKPVVTAPPVISSPEPQQKKSVKKKK